MADFKNRKTPELLLYFVKIYPYRFAVALSALLLAGVVETIGIGALLPLLNLVLDVGSNSESNLLSNAIDRFLGVFGIERSFQNLLMIIVLTITLKSLIIFQALKIVSYIAVDITYDLRQKFINALLSAKWTYYSTLSAGRSANAIATEADYAGQFCVITGKAISSVIQGLIYTIIAFAIDWKVSLAAIAMGAVAAFILKFLISMTRDAGNDMAAALNRLLARLSEALSGAKPIKAMGEEKPYVKILENDTADLEKTRKKLALSSLLLTQMHEPLLVVFMAIGLFWAYSYANYPMSELFMIAFLFNRLLSQVNMIQNHYQKTTIFEGAVNQILEKTKTALSYQETYNGRKAPSLTQEIKIENLGLSYDHNNVLEQFNNNIPAHKMTIIFGPSGSGKSSLLDAILGLIPYQKGQINIDQISLKDVDITAWRQMIGYVPQETFLFHDTIARNVTLGDDQISEDRIIQALKAADAWDFVSNIEDGLYHVVGEKGGKLSGGQRQRIAVARALVRKPQLLILDEATSSLDKKSEASILKTLKTELPAITIIMISHDPKALDIADHVIHMGKKG